LKKALDDKDADLVAIQTAHNAAQGELESLQSAVREVCTVVECGGASGSSDLARLKAVPARMGSHVGTALRFGISRTLGVLLSHYESLDLPRISEGLCVAPEEEGHEAEVMAELERQAEEAGAVSALALQFRPFVPGLAPPVEGEVLPGDAPEDVEATVDPRVA
jgi:hypothetical protein